MNFIVYEQDTQNTGFNFDIIANLTRVKMIYPICPYFVLKVYNFRGCLWTTVMERNECNELLHRLNSSRRYFRVTHGTNMLIFGPKYLRFLTHGHADNVLFGSLTLNKNE